MTVPAHVPAVADSAVILPDEVIVHLASGMSLHSGSRELTCGDYVRLCDADGAQRQRWDAYQWQAEPVAVMAQIFAAAVGDQPAQVEAGECVLHLAGGGSIRSGVYEAAGQGGRSPLERPAAGDYVRMCEADGEESAYWDCTELRDDPELVMGAILNVASGLRWRTQEAPPAGAMPPARPCR